MKILKKVCNQHYTLLDNIEVPEYEYSQSSYKALYENRAIRN